MYINSKSKFQKLTDSETLNCSLTISVDVILSLSPAGVFFPKYVLTYRI